MFLYNFHFLRFGHKGHFKVVNFFWQMDRRIAQQTDRPTDITNYRSSLSELKNHGCCAYRVACRGTKSIWNSKIGQFYSFYIQLPGRFPTLLNRTGEWLSTLCKLDEPKAEYMCNCYSLLFIMDSNPIKKTV